MNNLNSDALVYTPENIMSLLGISKSSTYAFLNKVYVEKEPFKVIKIGKVIRVPKNSFDNWLNS